MTHRTPGSHGTDWARFPCASMCGSAMPSLAVPFHGFLHGAELRLFVIAQANGVVDPELPASPPPQRPRRSSYASYAQAVLPQPAADGDGGHPAGEMPLPYTGWAGASLSADGGSGGALPRRPSSSGHSQQASPSPKDYVQSLHQVCFKSSFEVRTLLFCLTCRTNMY